MVNIRPLGEDGRIAMPVVNKRNLQRNIKEVNRRIQGQGIRFGIYDKTGIPYVQMIDNRTGKVVKTMPPQEFLQLKERLRRNIGGLINGLA